MEEGGGKWRFTSPTHTVRAFAQALERTGPGRRRSRSVISRYVENQHDWSTAWSDSAFELCFDVPIQSPIITAFYNPDHADYCFDEFYDRLEDREAS